MRQGEICGLRYILAALTLFLATLGCRQRQEAADSTPNALEVAQNDTRYFLYADSGNNLVCYSYCRASQASDGKSQLSECSWVGSTTLAEFKTTPAGVSTDLWRQVYAQVVDDQLWVNNDATQIDQLLPAFKSKLTGDSALCLSNLRYKYARPQRERPSGRATRNFKFRVGSNSSPSPGRFDYKNLFISAAYIGIDNSQQVSPILYYFVANSWLNDQPLMWTIYRYLPDGRRSLVQTVNLSGYEFWLGHYDAVGDRYGDTTQEQRRQWIADDSVVLDQNRKEESVLIKLGPRGTTKIAYQ